MPHVCLVACASAKHDHAMPAEQLYTSALFKKARAYALTHADRWFILSAKHGLLPPAKVIEPYDVTLNHMSTRDRGSATIRVIFSDSHERLRKGSRHPLRL